MGACDPPAGTYGSPTRYDRASNAGGRSPSAPAPEHVAVIFDGPVHLDGAPGEHSGIIIVSASETT